jgi:putative transcriptional regulator
MSKKTYDKIIAGLEDAIAHADGDESRGIAHMLPDVDVRAVRKKLGLSQDKFALRFGIPTSTLRNWEQGHRKPEGTARILLAVIGRYPKMVERVLHEYHLA